MPPFVGIIYLQSFVLSKNKIMQNKFSLVILLLIILNSVEAQVYTEKQTRHRFAQMTLGLDVQANFGGTSYFLNDEGIVEEFSFPNQSRTRFIIGGTHFWGHADFYVAIPLTNSSFVEKNQAVTFFSGAETGFKYYPLRIEHNKVRPFIGTALTPYFFFQNNNNITNGIGPEHDLSRLPIRAGFTFNNKNHLIELGMTYNYSNDIDYYISKTEMVNIKTPALFASIGYKYMFDTTIGAEQDWESGRTKEITSTLSEKRKLNGFFLGAAMSSASWIGTSDYNETNRSYITKYATTIMGDFTLGYYFHQPDFDVAINYRAYQNTVNPYGTYQKASRKSIGFETKKYIGDYHGFVPFIGPIMSYEKLSFEEKIDGQTDLLVNQNKLGWGITFGWDIRPNRIQWFTLRTNLRYFPNLKLDVTGNSSINFSNIEFNFIQFVFYPGRL